MTRILVCGGLVLDPGCDRSLRADVLIEDGRISAVAANLAVDGADRIDAAGCWVVPGFIDLHSHLREPGQE